MESDQVHQNECTPIYKTVWDDHCQQSQRRLFKQSYTFQILQHCWNGKEMMVQQSYRYRHRVFTKKTTHRLPKWIEESLWSSPIFGWMDLEVNFYPDLQGFWIDLAAPLWSSASLMRWCMVLIRIIDDLWWDDEGCWSSIMHVISSAAITRWKFKWLILRWQFKFPLDCCN